MKKEITEKQALERLAMQCARAEHSSGEMLQKMRSWGLSEQQQARIMERLTREKYVDDERFARAYVSDKMRQNGWGPLKISEGLWQKGVGKEVARQALASVSDDDYLQVLRPLLETKAKTVRAKNEFEHAMKLIRFAMSRGFTLQQIRKAIPEADDMEP